MPIFTSIIKLLFIFMYLGFFSLLIFINRVLLLYIYILKLILKNY